MKIVGEEPRSSALPSPEAVLGGWCQPKLAFLFHVPDGCFLPSAFSKGLGLNPSFLPQSTQVRTDLKPSTAADFRVLERHAQKSAEKNSDPWSLTTRPQNAQATSLADIQSRIKPRASGTSLGSKEVKDIFGSAFIIFFKPTPLRYNFHWINSTHLKCAG